MQRLNIQEFLILQQENLRPTNNMQDLKAFVDCATETELSSLFSVSLSLSWPSLHHGRVTKTIKGIMRQLTLSCDTYAKIATVNVHNNLQIKYFTFTINHRQDRLTKFLYSLSPVCDSIAKETRLTTWKVLKICLLLKHSTGSVIWQMYVGFCSELSYQQSFQTLKTANRDLTFTVAQIATMINSLVGRKRY